MSTIHANLAPGGDGGTLQRTFYEAAAIWETNVDTEPFLKHQPFTPKTAGHSETNVQNSLGNAPKSLLGGENHLVQRTPEYKRVILPESL